MAGQFGSRSNTEKRYRLGEDALGLVTSKGVLLFLLLAACACPSPSAFADTITPGDEIDKLYTVKETLDPLGANPVGEQVDLESGQLSIRQVDVAIPGNSDLPVEFARTFTPDGHYFIGVDEADARKDRNQVGELHDWRIDVPKIYAVLARDVGWPDNRCTGFGPPPSADGWKSGADYWAYEPSSYWHGYYAHIPGKGTHQLLDSDNSTLTPGDSNQFPIVTNNYWAVECWTIGGVDANGEAVDTPGEGFTLHTPDGRTYYFDHLTKEAQPGLMKDPGNGLLRLRYVMLASRVEDAFGNWVEYHYNSSGGLTSVQASDGRIIRVSYSGGKVASVTANSQTWTYSYAVDSNGHLHLDKVLLPDGRSWNFDVAGLADYQLSIRDPMLCDGPGSPLSPLKASGTITGPFGTTVEFVLEPTKRPRGGVSHSNCKPVGDKSITTTPKEYYTFALAKKTIGGPNMESLIWRYDYTSPRGWYSDAPGSSYKSTEVIEPDGDRAVYLFDMRADWREGNLHQVTYYDALDSSVFRQITYDYDLRSIDAGISKQMWANNARAEAIIRQSGQHTVEDGAQFNWQVTEWDTYDNPVIRREYNGAGDELKKQYTYENRVSDWWLGQLKSVTILAPADVAELKPYEVTYRADGRIGSVERFGRLVGTYDWNNQGLLSKITDPLGYYTELTNYYRGRPQNIRFPDGGDLTLAVNPDGTIASLKNTRGFTTSYDYDELGRLEKVTYPTNDIRAWDSSTFTLSTSGSEIRRTRTTGSLVETTYYDELLRPVLTQHGPSYISRDFDAAGRVVFESYPSTNPEEPNGIRYEYDGLGRLTKVERDTQNGEVVEDISYQNGNQRIVVDANSNKTIYTYRNLAAPDNEMLVKIEAAFGQPEAQTTVINRDGLGAMTSATRSGNFPYVSETRQYIYSAARDLCMVVDPETGLTVMHYDSRGLMNWQAIGVSTSSRDCAAVSVPASEKALFEYDGKGRLKTIDYPGTSNDISKTYDAEDNLKTISNGPVTWSYSYNGRNLLESEELTIDGRTFNLDLWYNSRAQLWSLAYPGGTQTVVFQPDGLGQPTRVGSVVTGVSYYASGAVKSYTYANGTTMKATQTVQRLPKRLDYPGINAWAYEYDSNGNLVSVDFQGPDGAPNEDRTNFGYDGLNRLLKVDGPWGASRFTYDALDNLLTKQYGSRTQSYSYDANNRLAAITGDLSYTLAYDAQGNITQRNDDTFAFDQANRMTSATSGGSYVYDGWGRRIKTTTPDGEVTYTIYSRAGQLVQEYKPASGNRTDYLYLARKLVAQVANVAVGPSTAGPVTVTGDPLDGDYTLQWSAVSGANRTQLVTLDWAGHWTMLSDGADLQKSISGKIGGDYAYRVAGCVSAGCGEPGPVLIVGVAPTKPDIHVPSTVQNGAYTVNWTAPATTTYFILEEYKNGVWRAFPEMMSAALSLPQVGGTYQYRVSAYNRHGTRGHSDYSDIVKVLPPAPDNLTTDDTTAVNSRFTLNWDSSAGATHYRLRHRKQKSDGSWWGWNYYSRITDTYNTFGYHDLSDGTYQFQVQAYTSDVGYGSWEGTPTVKVEWIPPAPTLSAPSYVPSMDLYTVSWSRPSGVTHFYLQRRHMEGRYWSDWVTYSTTDTSKQFLEYSGTFNVRVKGCKSFVCSSYSAIKMTTVGAGGCYTSSTETQAVKPEDTDQSQASTQAVPPPC